MTRKTLITLLAVSLFLSFSAQAGHKSKHGKHHHYAQHKKHHGHYQHHSRNHHWRGCKHIRHARYGRYAWLPARTHFELGARFVYSPDGAMIIQQPYLYGSRGY